MKITAIAIIFAAALQALSNAAEKAEVLSVKKIWDAAPHNAFTDLIKHDGKWLCTFREGRDHVSEDGSIRVIQSRDGDKWDSWLHLRMEKEDLRDPKICITPKNEVMLTFASADRSAKPVTHVSKTAFAKGPHEVQGPFEVGEKDMWLWRTTWHKGVAYSVGYETVAEKMVRLYHSKDGRKFDILVPNLFSEGYPNETGLIFTKDDTAICLLRRDGTPSSGKLGFAKPPYKEWTWNDLGVKIGGPQLIQLPDGRLIAGVRLYDNKVRTAIVELNAHTGKLTELTALSSNGDSSYPGLVWENGILHVSYYSSHEGKTSIYFARVRL